MTTRTMLFISFGGVLGVLAAVGLGFLTLQEPCRDFSAAKITVGQSVWKSAIAISEAEQQLGLSNCKKMPQHSGMYFPFKPARTVTFWMKRVAFPLDLVWISSGQVIGISPNLPPADNLAVDPPLYQSPGLVDGVLELPGGTAVLSNIKVGDLVSVTVKPK